MRGFGRIMRGLGGARGALHWCALSSRVLWGSRINQDKCELKICHFPQQSLSAGNFNSVKLSDMRSKEERG